MTNPRRRGVGRPSGLTDKITVKDPDTGQSRRVEVYDRLLELMEQGSHVDTAAAMIGVTRATVHDWLKIGADERKRPAAAPSDHVLLCASFSDDVQAAMHRWRNQAEAILDAAGRPRTKTTTVTKTIPNPDDPSTPITVETTTKVEELPADLEAIKYRLNRHTISRDDYRAPAQALEHSGPDGAPMQVEQDATRILDMIRTVRQQEQEPLTHDTDTST